jgi:hypothetical protein
MSKLRGFLLGGAAALLLTGWAAPSAAADVKVGDVTIKNHGLVAIGRIPANERDRFGETFGSSSGMAVVPGLWRKVNGKYEGSLMLLPDRGYNVVGTTDYNNRVNTVKVTLTPASGAKTGQLDMKLIDTLQLTDNTGKPLSGLDPDRLRTGADSLPILPETSTGKIAVDPEALVLLPDGSFFVSDEYGPYIFRFNAAGKMIGAIQPPEALLPIRKGEKNFSANAPGVGGKAPEPGNPETGRQNNQGLEAMAMTPDGKWLVAVLQSATRQDGGDSPATRNHTRALVYDISTLDRPKLSAEYVVPLPVFKDASGATLVAAQSEMVALSNTHFLLLSRDSNNGYGMKGATSLYRSIDVLDFTGATNIAGTDFDKMKPVAPKGVLDPSVKPAKLTKFIDINDNAQLKKYGLHNGMPNDKNNLSEKWESMAFASTLDPAHPEEFFLFVGNDNDFRTTDGFQVGAPYKDESGANVDTTFLVYKVSLPMLAKTMVAAQK